MGRDEAVGVGVIGRGFGRTVVAPVFEAVEGCTVVDVVSPRDEQAVRDLCEHPDVDLISVHSAPFVHRPNVECALTAGKAVLCDKPFGLDAPEADAMLNAAEAAGVVALVNFEFRCHPARAALRALVHEGAIGTVEHVQWTLFGSVFRRRRPNWVFDAELGGGWIGAWGSHAIDFVRWTFGEVLDAHAVRSTNVVDRTDREGNARASTAEDGFSAWLRTDAGATVVLDSTSVTRVDLPQRLVVLGSDGALEIVGDDRVVLHDDDGDREVFRFQPEGDPHLVPMRRWAEIVCDAVRHGVVPDDAPTFADGVACARVMDALRG